MEVRDVPPPAPHAPGWVLVRPALAGVCDSDLGTLDGSLDRSILSAYRNRGPFIPGHEVVGVVERAVGTRWVREGQRVLVEPTLRCAHKGLPECPRCRSGQTHLCENRDRAGALCSGAGIGSSARAGGAWSEGFLAHEDMLLGADGISDQRGVLAEPVAAALHAVLRWSRRGDRAVVIGTGAGARIVVASLRRLHPDLEITVARVDAEPSRARRRGRHDDVSPPLDPLDRAALLSLGASVVRTGTAAQVLQEVAARIGARVMLPSDAGLPVLDGGVDVVFDCTANEMTIDLAMRLVRGGGTVVMCARPERRALEWPLVWQRELSLLGSSLYGREANGHRTFSVVREWLADPHFPIDALVTHRFPLDDWDIALQTARAGAGAGAVKVVFEGSASALRPQAEDTAQHTHNGDAPLLLHATAARARSHRPA